VQFSIDSAAGLLQDTGGCKKQALYMALAYPVMEQRCHLAKAHEAIYA